MHFYLQLTVNARSRRQFWRGPDFKLIILSTHHSRRIKLATSLITILWYAILVDALQDLFRFLRLFFFSLLLQFARDDGGTIFVLFIYFYSATAFRWKLRSSRATRHNWAPAANNKKSRRRTAYSGCVMLNPHFHQCKYFECLSISFLYLLPHSLLALVLGGNRIATDEHLIGRC